MRTAQTGTDFSYVMKPPQVFGESSLCADEWLRTRQASALAGSGGATLIKFPVAAVETLVGFELQAVSRVTFNRKLMQSFTCAGRPLTEGLPPECLDTLLDCLDEEMFANGATVAAEAEFDEALFVIKSGEASVRRSGSSKPITHLRRNDCFGEMALVPSVVDSYKRTRRKASVVAEGDEPLIVLTVRPEHLELEGLMPWKRTLAELLMRRLVPGVDAVVVDRCQEEGKDVHQLMASQAKSGAGGKGVPAKPRPRQPPAAAPSKK